MSSSDRRFSSHAREIDAAIERVVAHFEENDLALRLDVLRGLSVHAKLAFETERLKQRLLQHPVAKELVERVTTQSAAFERLHGALAVEEFSCEYDRRRNVEMLATVRWTLPESDKKKSNKGKRRARTKAPLYTKYAFSRVEDEDGQTVVTYVVAAGVGVDGEMKELVRYELVSDSPYPRSFYEEDHDMDSEDGEDEESGSEEGDKQTAEPTAEEEPSENEEEEAGAKGDEEMDEFGEQIRGFDFDDKVLDTILDWLDAEAEDLEAADVIGFFLALPIYEDDWMIDERVCQILFNLGAGVSEMEEEEVSNFDENEDGPDVADMD